MAQEQLDLVITESGGAQVLRTLQDIAVTAQAIRSPNVSFAAMLQSINDTSTALSRLQNQIAATNQSMGAANTVTNNLTNTFNNNARAAGNMGTAHRGTASATRELLVLMREAANGNWSRFGGSLTLLAQYTGVLPNLFSLATLGLLSLAGAVAAFGLAVIQGQREENAFNESLALTNGISGETASSLETMAKAMSNTTLTTGLASEALAAVVQSGKVSVTNIQAVATAAADLQNSTGISIQTTVAQFERLADKPTQTIVELNDKMHFLSESTFAQIEAFEKAGDTADAAALAQSTYAAAVENAAKRVVEQGGYLEQAWNKLKAAAKGAWDAMANIGRPDTAAELQSKLDVVNKAISGYQARPVMPGTNFNQIADQAQLGNLLKERQSLQDQLTKIQTDGENARKAAAAQTLEDTKIRIDQQNQAILKSVENRQQMMTKDLNIAKQAYDQHIITLTQYEQEVAAIKQKYKQKGNPSDAGNNLLTQREQETAQLQQQLDATQKLSTAQRQLIADETKFASINPATATNAQKQQLAMQAQIIAQDKINVQLQQRIDLRKQENDLIVIQDQAAKQLAQDAQKYAEQLSGFTLGPTEKGQLTAQQNLKKDYLNKAEQATRDYLNGKTSSDTYQAELSALQDSLNKRLALNKDYYDQLQKLESNWENGLQLGLNTYVDSIKNVAAETSTLVSNSFKTMTDDLANFVTTGKLNFTDLVNSIVTGLAKIAIEQTITGPLASGLSSLLGGLFSGGSGGNVGANLVSVNGVPNAKGNVYSANSGLHDHINTVLTSPTLFKFADGAAFSSVGVAGEAGPEAVMPLKRGPDGALGVRSQGSNAPNVQVNIINNSSQQVTAKQGSTSFDGKKYVTSIILSDLRTNGPIAQAFKS